MVEPVSAYSVSISVINLIGKFIDNTWTQAQAHQFRSDENKAQHQFRLKELEKQYEQSILKAYRDSDIRVNEQQIIEQIKSSYAVSTNKVLKDSARDDANSPFYDGIEETYKNLKALHEKTHLPIILVSPFWDDTKSKELNDKGGYVDFLTAFNTSYGQAPWHTLAHRESGYLKRPLYQTERDINYIYSVLSDIPIILVHGTIQGVHSSDQRVQRIHPQITFWNLFPDQQDTYTSLNFKFVPLQLPTVNDNSPDIYQKMGEYSLYFQDLVGNRLTKGIGLLSSFYHLYYFETRPNLQQFQLENEHELEMLCFQMSEFYEFLAQKQPEKMKYYRNEKKLMLVECEINETTMRKIYVKDQHSTVELDATEIRSWFADQLEKGAHILTKSEKQAQQGGASGELALSVFICNLNREVEKLRDAKYKEMIPDKLK